MKLVFVTMQPEASEAALANAFISLGFKEVGEAPDFGVTLDEAISELVSGEGGVKILKKHLTLLKKASTPFFRLLPMEHAGRLPQLADMFPDALFLFLTCRPETYVASRIDQGLDSKGALKYWCQSSQAFLDFFYDHHTHCLVGDYEAFGADPSLLRIGLAERYEVELPKRRKKISLPELEGLDLLEALVLPEMMVVPEVMELQEELHALISLGSSKYSGDLFERSQEVAKEGLGLYHDQASVLVQAKKQAAKTAEEAEKLKCSNQELESEIRQISSQLESLEEAKLALKQQYEVSLQKVDSAESEIKELELKLTDARNSIQKHAEEKEAWRARDNEISHDNDVLKNQLSDIESENELLLLQIAQLQEEMEVLSSQSADGQAESRNELLLLQVAKLQEELEALYSQSAEEQDEASSPPFVNEDQKPTDIGTPPIDQAYLDWVSLHGVRLFGQTPPVWLKIPLLRIVIKTIAKVLTTGKRWERLREKGVAGQLLPAPGFDESVYLGTHQDVAAAVKKKEFLSGFEHYIKYGHVEGRRDTL